MRPSYSVKNYLKDREFKVKSSHKAAIGQPIKDYMYENGNYVEISSISESNILSNSHNFASKDEFTDSKTYYVKTQSNDEKGREIKYFRHISPDQTSSNLKPTDHLSHIKASSTYSGNRSKGLILLKINE